MSKWSSYLLTGKNAPTANNSGASSDSTPKQDTPKEEKKNNSSWTTYLLTGKGAPSNQPTAPKAEDFQSTNPLSDAVLRLQTQRDNLANAKATDPMSKFMQRRGLAEIDDALVQQTQRERAEKLPRNPITGTLLTPFANAPQSQQVQDALLGGIQTRAGEAAKQQVEPQTVSNIRKQLADIADQINTLDTNTAMVSMSGSDTSENAVQKQSLLDRRDYLTGQLKRYESILQPQFEDITDQISELSKRYADENTPQNEKSELFDQITNLNAQQKELMDALGIDKKPIVEWDGRQDLIKEYKQLSRADRLNPAQQARLDEVRAQLERGDALAGNGLQSYGFWDRASNTVQGAVHNVGGSLINAGATLFDAYSRGQSQQYGLGTAVSDQLVGIDPMSRLEMQTADYNSEESQALRQRMYDTADSISEDAREALEKAKGNLGTVGKAGVDIAENILEMGFDAGTAALTGGSSLAPMFLRVFGGAAQEARLSGATLDQQLGYGLTKAGIEVATEKMFDGVAHIYGAGAADDITEEVIRRLAETDTGRTCLRVFFSGQGEGLEEIVSELLDPLAKKIISDKSVGELYSELNPADVIYSYLIGSTIGMLGGVTNVVTGGNALSNAELRQREAGLGTDTQSENITQPDVKTSPSSEITSQPVNISQAEITQDNVATNALLDVLQNRRNAETGKVTNSAVNSILADQAMRTAFEEALGAEVKGTAAEQRAIVKDNADAVIDILTGNESAVDTTEGTAPEITVDNVAESQEKNNPQFVYVEHADTQQQDQRLADAYDTAINEGRGVVISEDALSKYSNIEKDSRKSLIQAIKDYYDAVFKGTTVDVKMDGGVITIMFENDGKKKSVGWRMKSEKAATFEVLHELTENSVYAYSEVNRDTSESADVPYFHYFVNNAELHTENGIKNVPVKIQTRDLVTGQKPGVHYYTHNIVNNNAKTNSPSSGESTRIAGNATEGLRIVEESSSTDTISQPASESKSETTRQLTKTQERVVEQLRKGDNLSNAEIDKLLNNSANINALESLGLDMDSLPADNIGRRAAVRALAQDIINNGIPSDEAVAKLNQDRDIQSQGQSDLYTIEQLEEELKAEEMRGDTERRKALAKQLKTLRERAERKGLLDKISKTADKVAQAITRPNEKNHVLKSMRNATMDFIETINGARDNRTATSETAIRASEKFDRITAEFERLRTMEDPMTGSIGEGFSSDVLAQMKSVSEMLGMTPLNELTNSELAEVNNALTAMNKSIRDANRLVNTEANKTAYESGHQMEQETRNEAKGGENHYAEMAERPETFFNRLAGWVKDSEWHKWYKRLNDGMHKVIDLKLQSHKMFNDLIGDKQYKTLRKEVSLKGLTDENGKPVKISRGMMLSLCLHLQNEQNTNHISGGGLTVADIADYYHARHDNGFGTGRARATGASQELSKLNYEYRQAQNEYSDLVKQGNANPDLMNSPEWQSRVDDVTFRMDSIKEGMDAVRESEADRIDKLRTEIENQLTDYERKFLSTAQDFFKWAQQNINDTTESVYGFQKALIENYFPVATDSNFRNVSLDETARTAQSLENAGFVQRRSHSNSPMLLLDITDVLNNYINNMAQYCGAMPVVKDFNKVWNTTEAGYADSLRNAVTEKFGKGAVEYVDNLILDLQGARGNKANWLERYLNTTRGNFAASVLTLNARVAGSQAASWFNAAPVVGWDNLIKSIGMGKADLDLIRRYSPLLEARSQGKDVHNFSDLDLTVASQRERITKKFWFALNWINDVDNATVRSLWNAAERYVQNSNAELIEGTDEYYKEVGKVFDDVVERTQPSYEAMQRPGILRDPSSLTRAVTMFMTQRLQNYNEVSDRLHQAAKYKQDFEAGKNGVTEADVKAANKAAVGAVTGTIASSLALTLMKSGIDALLHRTKRYRDDETGELTWESVALRIMDYTAESLFSNALFGAEAYQIAKLPFTGGKYYGTSVPGVDTISDTVEDVLKAFKTSKEKRPEAIAQAAGSLSSLLYGVPYDNAKGYVESVIAWADDFKNNTILESDANYTTAQNKKIIYDALTGGGDNRVIKNGNRVEEALARMGDNAEKNAKEAIRDHYKAGDIGTATAIEYLSDLGIDNPRDTVFDWQNQKKYDEYLTKNPESLLSESEYTRYAKSGTSVSIENYESACADLNDKYGKAVGVSGQDLADYLYNNYDEETAGAIFDILKPSNLKSSYSDMAESSARLKDADLSREEFDALMGDIDNMIANRTNEYDTKGYNEVMSALLGYDVGDGAKDAAMLKAGTKTNAVYQAVRENTELSANDTLSLLLGIDSMETKTAKYLNNGSINQDEIKAYYKEHPEEEDVIAIVWNAMGYTKDWETYKKSLK